MPAAWLGFGGEDLLQTLILPLKSSSLRAAFGQSRGEGEPRFSFVGGFVAGTACQEGYDHSPPHPRPGEFVLDETWQVVAVRSMGEVAATAVADFREYLDVAAGVKINLQLAEPGALQNHHKAVIVGLREQMPRYASGVERSESFHIEAGENSVIVCGFDERGIMRGLYYLQDLMDLRERADTFPRIDHTLSSVDSADYLRPFLRQPGTRRAHRSLYRWPALPYLPPGVQCDLDCWKHS